MIIKLCYFFSKSNEVQQAYGFQKKREKNQREKGSHVLMPIYEYRCNRCKKVFSQLFLNAQEVKDAKCKFCGVKDLTRLLTSFRVHQTEAYCSSPLVLLFTIWGLSNTKIFNGQKAGAEARTKRGIRLIAKDR
jgi:putative FmdB family regulatory protein